MPAPLRGLTLALSWLTVLPMPAQTPDPAGAAWAIRWAPVVGALLGAAAGILLHGLTAIGITPLVGGLLTIGFLALSTRGMHIDGLADTADGLGCYSPPERALDVMRDGGAGPFAVVTLLVVVGGQAAALAALAAGPAPTLAATAALAGATGRAGFGWVCRRGVPAARPGGLGATVAGSQPWWVAALWWMVLAGTAVTVEQGWHGALGVLLSALLVVTLSAHTTRRLGGMTGDVLGAACELAMLAVLVMDVGSGATQ